MLPADQLYFKIKETDLQISEIMYANQTLYQHLCDRRVEFAHEQLVLNIVVETKFTIVQIHTKVSLFGIDRCVANIHALCCHDCCVSRALFVQTCYPVIRDPKWHLVCLFISYHQSLLVLSFGRRSRLSHVLYMGISYTCQSAHEMSNST